MHEHVEKTVGEEGKSLHEMQVLETDISACKRRKIDTSNSIDIDDSEIVDLSQSSQSTSTSSQQQEIINPQEIDRNIDISKCSVFLTKLFCDQSILGEVLMYNELKCTWSQPIPFGFSLCPSLENKFLPVPVCQQ